MEKWLSTIDVEQSFKVPAWTDYENSLFPTRLHAQHAALEEMGRAWAERRLAPLLSLSEMQRVRDGQYGRLACHYWPFCPDEARSMVLIKFAYWIFLFDDLMDDPLLLRGNAQQVRLFCGHLLDVMFGMALEEGISGYGDAKVKREIFKVRDVVRFVDSSWIEIFKLGVLLSTLCGRKGIIFVPEGWMRVEPQVIAEKWATLH